MRRGDAARSRFADRWSQPPDAAAATVSTAPTTRAPAHSHPPPADYGAARFRFGRTPLSKAAARPARRQFRDSGSGRWKNSDRRGSWRIFPAAAEAMRRRRSDPRSAARRRGLAGPRGEDRAAAVARSTISSRRCARGHRYRSNDPWTLNHKRTRDRRDRSPEIRPSRWPWPRAQGPWRDPRPGQRTTLAPPTDHTNALPRRPAWRIQDPPPSPFANSLAPA